MSRVRTIWRLLVIVTVAAGQWMAVFGAAAARAAGKTDDVPKPGGGQSYALPYALVLLCIGLGMLFLLTPSKRRDRAKPEQYDEGRTKQDTK